MSVANQANEKLSQLVTLTAKIESYLNPNKDKKGGKKGAEEGGPKAQAVTAGKDITKESAAISGMSTSLTKLITAVDKINPNAGNKLKKFLVNLSDGVVDAAQKLQEANPQELIKNVNMIVGSAAKWTLAMIAIGITAPLVAVGTLVFALSVRAVLAILSGASVIKAKTQDSIQNVLSLAKGAALFALAMAGIGILAIPFALGVTAFTLGVAGMLFVFSRVSTFGGKTKQSIDNLLSLAKGAALFALAMIGIGMLAPQFALGVVVFTLAVSAMLLVFSKLTGIGTGVTKGINAILSLAKGAALFALTMVGIGLVAPLFALGVVVFTLAVSAMILVFSRLTMNVGVTRGLNSLFRLAKGAALFALTMVGIALVAPLFALGTITFALGVLAISFVLNYIGKNQVGINKGIASITKMILPIAGISVVLFLIGLGAAQIAMGALVAAGSIIVLGLATYLVGKLDSKRDVTKGILVLYELGPALILFSAALFILAAAPASPAELALKMAVIAGAVVVLGLAAYVLGLPAVFPFVILGAEALVALSIPLILFSAALFILSKAKFDKEQAENLGYVIKSLGVAVSLLGLMIVPIMLGSVAMLPMSLALMAITPALAKFKEIDWQESDSESLKSAMKGVVQAYVGAFSGVGFLELLKLAKTIPLIGKLGTSLASLAAGVKAMATLTFIESEYDEKTGKLVPKREVRLSNSDIQAVGPNVAAILNALAEPLTNFGKWATEGMYTFGPFTLGSGYMSKGIDMAGKIGTVISSIAKGVQAMANLEVIEYEVVGKGTKDAKLVPKGSRKLTPLDFINAGIGVSSILGALTKPLLEFGEAADKGDGWFTNGYLQKGIDASKGISDFIGNLATGVANMANLEVTEYEIVGKGTKDAKLVPKNTRKLNNADFSLAGENVGKLLGALIKPLTDFGRAYADGSGWFSDSSLQSGIEAVGKIGEPIASLAKAVTDMAAGRATISDIVDGKLVPKSTISFAEAIPLATEQLGKLLESLPKVFVTFGEWYDENEDAFDDGIDAISPLIGASSDAAKIAESYVKALTELDKAVPLQTKSIQPFLMDIAMGASWIGSSFAEGKFGAAQVNNYDRMVTVTERLARIVTPFEKFAKSFGIFARDMGVFTRNFEIFGKDNAANFKVMGEVVDKVAKVDVGKLKEAMKTLNEYAKEETRIAQERKASNIDQSGTSSTLSNTLNTVGTTQARASAPPAPGGAPAAQFPSTIANITVGKIVVTSNIEVSGDINEK